MRSGDALSARVSNGLSDALVASGLSSFEIVGVALDMARRAALDIGSDGSSNLWVRVYSKLVQTNSVGRPDLSRMLTKAEFCEEVGLSCYKIEKLDGLERLLVFETYERRVYPKFQAWRGGLLPGVADVNSILAREALTMETRALFYLWPLFDGVNVLEVLRIEAVVQFARSFRGFFI
ncbi:hypothetical protein QEH56_14570 [Pelagicoccus enzymogenes]|uniref:hypothetical protein n=1 Tax=Pelagicoccus enzymogenes TaxID=2773457 RepID=UPI00280DA3DA|nr:hypothetical protein [Pelagicoccus enzymogenes]MDQ8199387.1 hypothetical protein [Pelagicoccus enzymogenes]